jgi:Flp pilus assembly pilin Flp
MAGSYVGGNLAEINAASSKLAQAGTAATAAGSQTSVLAARLTGEVGDVSTALIAHFNEVAQELNGAITTAKQNLGVATWSGRARDTADAAEQRLTSDVNATLSGATQAVETLKTQLLATVQQFQTDVDGRFNQVLTNINTSYGQLAKGLDAYAANLAEVDANSIRVAG